MDDKSLLEDILYTAKDACSLYLNGTVEASTPNVHSTFNSILTDSLQIQNDIFSKMSQKGWYSTTVVDQQRVQQVATQFAGQQQ